MTDSGCSAYHIVNWKSGKPETLASIELLFANANDEYDNLAPSEIKNNALYNADFQFISHAKVKYQKHFVQFYTFKNSLRFTKVWKLVDKNLRTRSCFRKAINRMAGIRCQSA